MCYLYLPRHINQLRSEMVHKIPEMFLQGNTSVQPSKYKHATRWKKFVYPRNQKKFPLFQWINILFLPYYLILLQKVSSV